MSEVVDDVAMVPVPRKYLGVVYRALGKAMDSESADQPDDGSLQQHVTTSDVAFARWSVADLERLFWLLSERGLQLPIIMMDQAALAPGEGIKFVAIQEQSGLTWGEARGQLAQLTRLIKKEFRRSNWPTLVQYADGGKAIYLFDNAKSAEAWLEARQRSNAA